MAWVPGETVEQYLVLDVAPESGMGVVHRVRHRDWGIDLAVKTPKESLRWSDDWRSFEAEAETWVGLGVHPHTVACVYVRRLDGIPRVFAEWVDGGTLAEAISSRRLYEGGLARILDIAIQMAWGLQHAHAHELVHQDVKPANVMLERDWTAKVTDFGLTRALARSHGPEHPGGAPVAGMTPAYCSPEQAEALAGGVRSVTTATDVWSWALCVFEMFNGERPTSRGETADQVFADFDAAPGLPQIPPGVADLLRACFRRDPAARPSLADAAATLAAVYGDYPRAQPEPVRLLADGLSNRALSMLDLGRSDEAVRLWQEATAVDPHHVHAVYNSALYLWRKGTLTDDQVVSELTSSAATRADPLDAELLGHVQRERGEIDHTAEFDGHVRGEGTRPAQVTALATSGDGRTAVSGDSEGRLLVWSPRTGERLHELTAEGESVAAVAVDGAGTTALTARGDGTLELWDLRRGRSRFSWSIDVPMTHVVISPDATVGMTAHENGSVLVWGLTTGSVDRFLVSRGPVNACAMSPDARHMVSAGLGIQGDGAVRVVDLATRRIGTLAGGVYDRDLIAGLDGVAIAPDARLVLLAGWHHHMVLWDSRTDRVVSAVPHGLDPPSQHHLALTTDGRLLLSAVDGGRGHVRFWEPASGRARHTLEQDTWEAGWVTAVAISGDDTTALIAGLDGRVRVRSLPAGEFRAPWSYARPTSAGGLVDAARAFHRAMDRARQFADDERFAEAADELREARELPGFARHPDLRALWSDVGRHGTRAGLLGAWPVAQLAGLFLFTRPVTMAWSADGTVGVVGGGDARMRVFDLAAGRVRLTFPDDAGRVASIALSWDERCAVSLSRDDTVRVWDFESGRCRLAVDGRSFGLARQRLLVGDNGTMREYDLGSGVLQRVIMCGGGPVEVIAVSPDGGRALAADGERARVIDMAAGAVVGTVPAGRGSLGWFSPDGEMLVVYPDDDLDVVAWEVRTMREMYRVGVGWSTSSSDPIVDLGADWRLAVSNHISDGVRVWDIPTGQIMRRLPCAGPVHAVAVSDDSRFAVTADDAVRIWDLESGRCLRQLEAHDWDVTGLALGPDGSWLVTADASPRVCCWGLDWDYDLGPRTARPKGDGTRRRRSSSGTAN